MKHTKFMATSALAITAATVFAGVGHASSITIDDITPQWTDIEPEASVTSGTNGSTITLRWGDPAVNDPLQTDPPQQSGYDFTPRATSFTVNTPDTPFLLGNFNHLNFPVFPPSLESVNLSVEIDVGGVPVNVTSVFEIDHDETTNTQSLCEDDTPPCDDIVTISNSSSPEQFTIGGIDYVFEVLGFIPEGAPIEFGSITTEFFTVEGQENAAGLYASYTASDPISSIPLPAAGWMLLAGIGGLAAMRRRKKA